MLPVVEKATDKQFLRSIANREYSVPDELDPFEFAIALLQNLGSPDEELRDELSYMILASGILAQNKLNGEQLEQLLKLLLSEEHLFFRIGEAGTDSVFMRSFSNLIIAAILYTDAKVPALSPKAVKQTKSALLRYAREERDWRGYVEGKGWAHAMAHLADALDICAQNQHIELEDRKDILRTLSMLCRLPVPLFNEEDVRLATVAYHMILGKQIEQEFLLQWIESCYVQRKADVSSWRKAANAKNFLRSLYFLLLWDNIALTLLEPISEVLRRQDEPYVEGE